MLGLFAVAIGGLLAGNVARGIYFRNGRWPLRLGWVLSSISAIVGAIIDILSGTWVALGIATPASTSVLTYVIGTMTIYVIAAGYIVAVRYYGRLIPVAYGWRRRS